MKIALYIYMQFSNFYNVRNHTNLNSIKYYKNLQSTQY